MRVLDRFILVCLSRSHLVVGKRNSFFVNKRAKSYSKVFCRFLHLLCQLFPHQRDILLVLFHRVRHVHQVVQIHWIVGRLFVLDEHICGKANSGAHSGLEIDVYKFETLQNNLLSPLRPQLYRVASITAESSVYSDIISSRRLKSIPTFSLLKMSFASCLLCWIQVICAPFTFIGSSDANRAVCCLATIGS